MTDYFRDTTLATHLADVVYTVLNTFHGIDSVCFLFDGVPLAGGLILEDIKDRRPIHNPLAHGRCRIVVVVLLDMHGLDSVGIFAQERRDVGACSRSPADIALNNEIIRRVLEEMVELASQASGTAMPMKQWWSELRFR